jgi:hypothetical protein
MGSHGFHQCGDETFGFLIWRRIDNTLSAITRRTCKGSLGLCSDNHLYFFTSERSGDRKCRPLISVGNQYFHKYSHPKAIPLISISIVGLR